MSVETPYGRKGSGWSGSSTSRERQEREDADGTTGWRQQQVVEHLGQAGPAGMTCGELERGLEAGHGAVSAALSVLHRAGTISRITERRNRQEVYVLPDHVDGREVSPFRPRFSVNRLEPADVEMLEDQVREAFVREMEQGTGVPAARLAVDTVLDSIRKMSS